MVWTSRILAVLLIFTTFGRMEASPLEEIYTVIVLLESKSGKEDELEQALIDVAMKSRAETSCLGYHVYQDRSHPTKFGLVEKWESQELHQEQFTKPYIVEFAKRAEPLLEKPYEGLFGEEVEGSKLQ